MHIKDMYVNIAIKYTLIIANKLLKKQPRGQMRYKRNHVHIWMIMNRNYFQYDDRFYKANSGIVMSSLLSNSMAEIFTQDLEQNGIEHLLEDGQTISYNRYLEDIFVLYNQTKLTPQSLCEQFSAQHKDPQLTINEEVNQIAYLDINLINKQGQIKMELYRKPKTTYITIKNNSCHPKNQKLAAYKN